MKQLSFLIATLLFLPTVSAPAQEAQKCEARKDLTAGKTAQCIGKQYSKEILGRPTDFAACTDRLITAFERAETSAGPGVCPTETDGAAIAARIATAVENVALTLRGVRFVDNGDGTITDTQTGLMWERKVAGTSCVHCVDDTYPWPDAMSEWISSVNGYTPDGTAQSGLAGHTDWRVPSIAEFRTILLSPYPCATTPCIDPAFGDTSDGGYWTSTTLLNGTTYAMYVAFNDGFTDGGSKTFPFHVRAVRNAW